MAWIESHQTLSRHRKTLRAASILGCDRHKLIGHLHQLWWWALDNVGSDGCLGDLTDAEIAAAAEWDGDATAFVQALTEAGGPGKAGFIEVGPDGRYLHNWSRYAGKLLDERESRKRPDLRRAYADGTIQAVRKRDGSKCRYCGREVDWADRRTERGGTYDWVDPSRPPTADNLVVACRGCVARKGQGGTATPPGGISSPSNGAFNDASNAESNAHRPTVPYRTVPNDLTNTHTPAGAGSVPEKKKAPYSQDFERFWSIYPRRQEKQAAWACWQTRLREGWRPEDLVRAAERYAAQVKGTEQKYIKLPKTFLGPNKPFSEYLPGVGQNGHAADGPGAGAPGEAKEGRYAGIFRSRAGAVAGPAADRR